MTLLNSIIFGPMTTTTTTTNPPKGTMTDNERILRDALTEALVFITGLLAKDHYDMVELAITNGSNIERIGLEVLRKVEPVDDGPECCGCVNRPSSALAASIPDYPGRLTHGEPPEPQLRI